MRRKWLYGLTFLLISTVASAENWKELKGDHFIVYYEGEDNFVREVLRKAESYYHDISMDLGYARYSNFWMWENRVKIYIYPTRQEFLNATNDPTWSEGVADYTHKEIRSYLWSQGFLGALLPHEMTHLIFRDYVGFKGEVPLWLDEGVAQWEEPAKRAVVRQAMKSILEKNEAFSLAGLTQLNVGGSTEKSQATRFYIQAASLVDFLNKEYGSDRFISFCRELREGKSLDEALRFTYPTSIRNLNELEEKWRKYILATP